MVRVKICCISSIEEAQLAVKYGASALGLVSAMPSGPGIISEDDIEHIASITPPGIDTFLLTSRQDVDSIILQQKKCRTKTIQLCDNIINGSYQDLRDALPGISLVQVIHVNGWHDLDDASAAAEYVDALLLDSGNKHLDIKKLGGTGHTHDWAISAEIVKNVSKPVFLAGGLNSKNVSDAIAAVNPFGIDLCNGVRTNNKLDEEKLSVFFKIINEINFHH